MITHHNDMERSGRARRILLIEVVFMCSCLLLAGVSYPLFGARGVATLVGAGLAAGCGWHLIFSLLVDGVDRLLRTDAHLARD